MVHVLLSIFPVHVAALLLLARSSHPLIGRDRVSLVAFFGRRKHLRNWRQLGLAWRTEKPPLGSGEEVPRLSLTPYRLVINYRRSRSLLSHKGDSIHDVRKIFGYLDPPPLPLVTVSHQLILFFRMIFREPPPPPTADVICWKAPKGTQLEAAEGGLNSRDGSLCNDWSN